MVGGMSRQDQFNRVLLFRVLLKGYSGYKKNDQKSGF